MKDIDSLYEMRCNLGAWSADAVAGLGNRDCPNPHVLSVPQLPRRFAWHAAHPSSKSFGHIAGFLPRVTRPALVQLLRYLKDVAAVLVCLVGHHRLTSEAFHRSAENFHRNVSHN